MCLVELHNQKLEQRLAKVVQEPEEPYTEYMTRMVCAALGVPEEYLNLKGGHTR
jgi:hypothetical protein